MKNEHYFVSLQKREQKAQAELDQLAGLQKATQFLSISAGEPLKKILDELLGSIGKALQSTAIAFWKPTKDQKHLFIYAHQGMTDRYVRLFDANPLRISRTNVVGTVAVAKQPYFISDIREIEKVFGNAERKKIKNLIQLAAQEQVLSIASLPVVVEDKLAGVLNFYFAEPHNYSPREKYILGLVGNIFSIAIGNTQYRQELQNTQKALLNMLEDTDKSRQRSEEDRRKTELIIHNLSDGLLVFDARQIVEFVNSQAEKVFNMKSSDIVGKHMNDLKIISQFPWLKRLILKEYNRDTKRELLLPRSSLVFEITVVPLQYKKVHRGVIVVFHDITREKQIELLKTEFVSLAAHQLRTPLSAIKWATKMLLDGDAGRLAKAQQDLLQKSFESTERMIRLINDLLNMTRIEEGRYLYRPALAQIGDIIKSMVESYQDAAQQKKIRLELKGSCKDIPQVLVDIEKIRLAIQNLLDNALHYTKKGGKVTVGIWHDTKEVRVSFTDTGIGIPQEQQQRVFEKFFRAANARMIDTDGSGLGLYLVHNIVEAHGGKVWFESEEGKGSTFTFSLPIKNES